MNGDRSSLMDFTRKTLIAVGIGAAGWVLVTVLMTTFPLLLLVFAGVLLGVFMRSASQFLAKYIPIPLTVWLAMLWLALAAILLVVPWEFGPVVAGDMDNLIKDIPKSLEQLRGLTSNWEWAQQLLSHLTHGNLGLTSSMMHKLLGMFSNLLALLSSFLLILVLGLYFSFDPRVYINGVVKLIPKSRRDHGCEVLQVAGHTLFGWVLSRIVSMIAVGALVYFGLLVLGVDQPLILAVIAGALTFVPYLGAIISAVPAMLIALGQHPMLAVYVALLYLLAHLIEGYFLTPYVQWRFISMPPALVLAAQVLMGIGTGVFGVILASPLVVVLRVLAELLYVRDALHDEKVPLNPNQPQS